MADVIDLSTLGTDKKDDLDSLSTEEREAVDALADAQPEEDEAEAVATAFLVILTKDGQAFGTPELDLKVRRDRIPTADDFYTASSAIMKDVQIQETAHQVTMMMQQMAHAAQQQMANAALAQRLDLPK